jgi:hypothetical protein
MNKEFEVIAKTRPEWMAKNRSDDRNWVSS